MRVLSLGAGVQSTTLALMIARGDLPSVDCAIFSDTQWEPAAVYKHLDWLEAILPFPVYRVTKGNLRADLMAGMNSTGQQFSSVPWFIIGKDGKEGMGRRQCTSEYKLRPLQRKVVELMGGKRPRGGCEMLIGISQDEAWRRKPSRVQYIVNQFPLLDKQMTRQDCLRWMEERQYPKPAHHTWKSFCNLLLRTMPEKTRDHYTIRFKKFIIGWHRRGYEVIPDESPPELEANCWAPSWRRMCKVLLRNDYWCKGLGFTQPKSAAYEKYKSLMKAKKEPIETNLFASEAAE